MRERRVCCERPERNVLRTFKIILFLTILAAVSSSYLRAQSGTTYRDGPRLTCASDDGNRHYCAADTRYGVRLVNQRSGSPCRQDYSWGYDRRGIWVDRGCRADFVTRVVWNGGPGPGGPGCPPEGRGIPVVGSLPARPIMGDEIFAPLIRAAVCDWPGNAAIHPAGRVIPGDTTAVVSGSIADAGPTSLSADK
jgi:hypothetical protein